MMEENESGTAESSVYPVRPGRKDCQFYLTTGRCGYGETCRYNHPKEIPPEKINMPKCKYFLRGKCKNGSRCDFDHSKEEDGAEHTRQGQKRHRTESKTRSSPSPEKRKHRQEDIKKQSTEAEDNLQEEKLRETQENDNDQQNREEQRKRDIEKQRREACLRLKQIKQTVHFDEAIRETLKELGFILTEGDGF